MPEWWGGQPSPDYFISWQVFQVTDAGLLIETKSMGTSGDLILGKLCFLKNYPYEKEISDGQQIHFLAMQRRFLGSGSASHSALKPGCVFFASTRGHHSTRPLFGFLVCSPCQPFGLR